MTAVQFCRDAGPWVGCVFVLASLVGGLDAASQEAGTGFGLDCDEALKKAGQVYSLSVGTVARCTFANPRADAVLHFQGLWPTSSGSGQIEIVLKAGAGQIGIGRFFLAPGQEYARQFFIPSSTLGFEKTVDLRFEAALRGAGPDSPSGPVQVSALKIEPRNDLAYFKLAETEAVELRSPKNPYRNLYTFSAQWDWFTRNIPVWERFLGSYREQPDLNYLEVGVFEGRSFVWMLENVLNHPSSRATAVDLFGDFADLSGEDLKKRFLENVERSGSDPRVTVLAGYSQVILRGLPLESFDIIYIDGSHEAGDVLEDTLLCWRLLKTGGTLIFDDYPYPGVEFPVNAFLQLFGSRFEILHRGYQLFLRKRSS